MVVLLVEELGGGEGGAVVCAEGGGGEGRALETGDTVGLGETELIGERGQAVWRERTGKMVKWFDYIPPFNWYWC